MCGRYTNTQGPEEIGAHFGVHIGTDGGTQRYNVAPTQEVLAIVAPKPLRALVEGGGLDADAAVGATMPDRAGALD